MSNHATDRGCLVDGCTDPYHGRGYCNRHLLRIRRNGDLVLRAGREREHPGPCEECGQPIRPGILRAPRFCRRACRTRHDRRKRGQRKSGSDQR